MGNKAKTVVVTCEIIAGVATAIAVVVSKHYDIS